MNSNFLKKIKNKIIGGRDENILANSKNTIEVWEFFLLIIGCHIKEILETISTTVNWSEATKFLNNNQEILTIITKFGLGLGFIFYFVIKYKKEKLTTYYILSLLFYSCIIPSLQTVGKKNITGLSQLFEIITFVYPFAILVIFFKIDTTNLDALKLLMYEKKDLIIYREEKRIFRIPKSQISYKKLGELLIWSFGTLIFGIIITKIITQTYIAIKYGIKSSTNEIATKNQEGLEKDAKNGVISAINIAISAIIIAPLLEEFIFRKCIMKLNNYRWWTVIISAFIFGLIHLRQESLEKIIPYMAPGLAFAISMNLKKNIWYTITAHMMQNIIAFCSIFIFR